MTKIDQPSGEGAGPVEPDEPVDRGGAVEPGELVDRGRGRPASPSTGGAPVDRGGRSPSSPAIIRRLRPSSDAAACVSKLGWSR